MPTMSIRVHKNLQKAHEYKLQITNFAICKILYFPTRTIYIPDSGTI